MLIAIAFASGAVVAQAQQPAERPAAAGVPKPQGGLGPGNPAAVVPNPVREPAAAVNPADVVNPAGPLGVVAPGGGLFAPGGGFSFPSAYGGWGGWGGATAPGDIARGMGSFAAGLGSFNRDTATANAIQANTVMHFNEYLYQSQQIRNARYFERLAREREKDRENVDTIYQRLRDNPEPRDIASGAALNVVLDDLTEPGVYVQSIAGASAEIPGAMVREIPFQYAAQAVTISLNDFLNEEPPKVLQDPVYKQARQELIAATTEANTQIDDDGAATAETLDRIRSAVDRLWSQFDQEVAKGVPDRREGENYLKGVYGLTRMLESPELDRYLGELDPEKPTTLGNLVAFMSAFNLRFGVADKPAAVDTYNQLYPMLVTTRDQVIPADRRAQTLNVPTGRRNTRSAAEFFSGLEPVSSGPDRTIREQPETEATAPPAAIAAPDADPQAPQAPARVPAADRDPAVPGTAKAPE